jgi:serine/threonine protein phosphatase PrpC
MAALKANLETVARLGSFIPAIKKVLQSRAQTLVSMRTIEAGIFSSDKGISNGSKAIEIETREDLDLVAVMDLASRIHSLLGKISASLNWQYGIDGIASQTEQGLADTLQSVGTIADDLIKKAQALDGIMTNFNLKVSPQQIGDELAKLFIAQQAQSATRSFNPDLSILCNVTRGQRVFENVAINNDRGNRENNEDAAAMHSNTAVAVADGMGGANAGEVASRMALDVLFSYLISTGVSEQPEFSELPPLVKAAYYAHREILHKAHQLKIFKGMGTTLVAIVNNKLEKKIVGIKIGDSRIKAASELKAYGLGKDHSLFQNLFEANQGKPFPFLMDDDLLEIVDGQAAKFEENNVIVSCLGTPGTLTITYFEIPYEESPEVTSRFALYSDGVNSGKLGEKQVTERLTSREDPGEIAKTIVEEAKISSEDNITVGVMILNGIKLLFDKAVHHDYRVDEALNIMKEGETEAARPLAKTLVDPPQGQKPKRVKEEYAFQDFWGRDKKATITHYFGNYIDLGAKKDLVKDISDATKALEFGIRIGMNVDLSKFLVGSELLRKIQASLKEKSKRHGKFKASILICINEKGEPEVFFDNALPLDFSEKYLKYFPGTVLNKTAS